MYYHWLVVSRKEWRLADTPLASAEKFLKDKGEKHGVERMEVEPEPGTEVVAFYVKEFISGWAAHTQELAMDSTCMSHLRVRSRPSLISSLIGNTNGGNFELFAAVASDANGSGIPLAFMFISTTKDAAPGAKRAVLERFLGNLKDLGVHPEFTLTDKDWSEIGAMRVTWDTAKHQLCFWHGLRAVKQRLVKNKDTPASYDAEEAHRQFSFIDVAFVPASQQPPGRPVRIPRSQATYLRQE